MAGFSHIIGRAYQGRGPEMTEKETEMAVERAIAKARANFEKHAAEFRAGVNAKMAGLDDSFSIDTIEDIWGKTERENHRITEELMNELGRGIREEELLKKKEKSTGKWK
jgi:hypothetical protein